MTEDDYVAWVRYIDNSIQTCDSDAEGAFKVYRHPVWRTDTYLPSMDEAYRFMKSNPLTSADMLKEIQGGKSSVIKTT